jgi:hypothetical protein
MSTAEERMQDAIEELEQENRLLRARNERLERESEMRRLAILDTLKVVPVVQQPAFHGFMDTENCCVHICYTPWAPRMTDGKFATAYYTTPTAAPVQPVDIATLVEGMEVSIDVSTGEHDSGNRLFGSVTLVQENQGSKHGLILLVQEPEANFKTVTATAQQCKWPTCQSEKYQQSLVKQIEQELVTGITQQWVDLTDRQIESIFIDSGWSWGGKANMYVPAVREVLKLFKETNE